MTIFKVAQVNDMVRQMRSRGQFAARGLSYDPQVSGLAASDIQTALDLLAAGGGGGGGGSVTSVSINAPHSVTNPTTTPAILIDLSGYVPTTRTVNGQALSANVVVTTITGNAGTATALQTPRAINGVNFDGTAAITVAAAAGTLTGATLAAGVTASSLTSFGASIALGTPASGTLTNCTFPTLNQNTTGSAAKWTTPRTLAGNSVDGSANVAFANKFIVQGTVDAGLSAAQFLGALATGIVKNTTATGVLSIGVAATDYVAPGATTTSGLTMATARLLGRSTAATGAIEEITVGSGLSLSAGTLSATGGGSGDVSGPASAVTNRLASFNGTTGKLIMDSGLDSATILTTSTAVTVAQGGTGRVTSTTAYGLIAAGTTATGAHQTLAAGLTTQILVGGGASALPVWTTAQGSGAPVRATSPTITTPTVSGTATMQGLIDASGASAGQIKFPAAQNASADANTLDDYEEGTFTPVAAGTSTAGAGTYTVQNGSYTKVGRQVTICIFIGWSAHTGTGNVKITGLPFASNAGFYASCAIGQLSAYTLAASSVMTAYILPSAAEITIEQYAVGGGVSAAVAMDTSTQMMISGTYFV